jgi:hypothetical protein
VVSPRARVHEQVGMALDEQARHAVPGQEERTGQAADAAADDQHWNSGLCHTPELDTTGASSQGQLFELFAGLLRQLSADKPVLLLIDDLH